jgi:mono/diheme cytochrome c family protein
MRYILAIGALTLVSVFLIGTATDAVAYNGYLRTFNDLYGTSGTRLDNCGICHDDFSGGGRGNDYYDAWVAAGGTSDAAAAYRAIEADDSDGDGTYNLAEIEALFHPGYSCDTYPNAQGAPADLADWVNPDNIGCGTVVGPEIGVSPSAVDFGQLEVGASASEFVRVTNVGDADLTISGAALNGSVEFSVDGPALPLVLAPSGSAEWTVLYSPQDEGADSGTFEIASDDPANSNLSLDISGSGFIPAPVALDLDIAARGSQPEYGERRDAPGHGGRSTGRPARLRGNASGDRRSRERSLDLRASGLHGRDSRESRVDRSDRRR